MKKTILIVGGGASALMLACELDPEKFAVSIYERNAALGRKFLVAGDGGLNLTHSENKEKFILRYTPFLFLKNAFNHFSNSHLINWFRTIGVETFVGSSGRVFPVKGIKPAQVLSLVIKKITEKNVSVHYKHTWKGFRNNELLFDAGGKEIAVKSDIMVFCLGGASWPVTGSEGEWASYFKSKNIRVNDFKASNCAFKINWPEDLKNKIEGKVLKNILVSCSGRDNLGEVVLTRFGVEGSGIYPLSPQIRGELESKGKADVTIDFKPSLSQVKISDKLKRSSGGLTESLRTELKLNACAVQLLKTFISKDEFLDIDTLSFKIKNFKISITALGPIEDAISTAGGINLDEVNENFELKKLPSRFVIGEMLDYDAPTGGYFLQSCFSMGKYLADFLNEKSD